MRIRRILAALAAVAVGGVTVLTVAPAAHAADESMQISSFSPNTVISGRGVTTVTATTSWGYAWAEVDFATTDYSMATWAGSDPSNCPFLTLTLNGAVLPIDYCLGSVSGGYYYYYVESSSVAQMQPGDVVVLSWTGSGVATTSSGEFSANVWDVTTNNPLPVIPTLLASASAARPIWHLSLGRASAEATCTQGYAPSWAQWPNGGTGGWVCNRDVYADAPLP